MLSTAAPLLMAGGCLEPECDPNCGCSYFDFPVSGSAVFSLDSVNVTLRDEVRFSLLLAPVEVAHENDEGRITWYDTVTVGGGIQAVSVRNADRSWGGTFEAAGGGGAFLLPYTSPEGWLTITSVGVTTPRQNCPMGSLDQYGTVPVSSDSLWVVPSPMGYDVFTDSQLFTATTGATLTVSYPDPQDPTTTPYTENGVTLAPIAGATLWVGEHTPVLAGNEFTVSNRAENVDITFATPVTAFGLWMVDGGEPVIGYNADSEFRFTFVSEAGDSLGPTKIDPPIDKAFFVGFKLPFAVIRIAIREVGSTGDLSDPRREDDYFGRVYTK